MKFEANPEVRQIKTLKEFNYSLKGCQKIMLMLLYCQELKGKKILDERLVINSDNQASLRLAQEKNTQQRSLLFSNLQVFNLHLF